MKASRRFHAVVCLLASLGAAKRTARAADPTTAQCLAATESSLGLRKQHKLREARGQLLVCAASSCPADIRDECVRRMGEVNAAIPTVVFEARDAAGNDLAGVAVTIDGQPLVPRLDGTPLALDPGAHTFVFATPGEDPVRKEFVIREGEKNRRERIVVGARGMPLVVATPETSPPTPATVVVSPRAVPAASDGATGLGTQRILAIAAAGVGVVGIGFGIGFGLDSMSKHDAAHKLCPENPCADKAGVGAWNEAVTAGNISTAGFIVGAVGIAAGAALWFTGKPEGGEAGARTQVGLGPGSLQLRGVW